jgi:hypothetical protein
MRFRILILFSFLSLLFCQKEPSILFSIDNTTIQLTNEMNEILLNTVKDNNNPTLGFSELINIKYSELKVDLKIPFSFEIKYNNGDLSSERLQFLFASSDGDLIPYEKVKIHHLNYENNIPSYPFYYNIKIRNYSETEIECFYTQELKNYNILNIYNNLNIKKIESFYHYTFALGNDNKVYKVFYANNVINFAPLVSNDKFNDFFIGNNGDLILVEDKIYIYKIIKGNTSFDLNIKKINEIDLINYNKIVYYSSKIYIIAENKLYEVNLNNKTTNILLSLNDYISLSDLLIEDDRIYIIGVKTNSKHLLIYSLSNSPILLNRYVHSKIKQIDIYNHPFNGHKFLGISFEQDSDYSEFFAEFLIDSDDDKPLILNKIFTSLKRNFINYITKDNFFSYFYDNKYKQIFFIRRGFFNSAYFQTINYKLDFSANIISMIYYNNINVPLFISDNSFYILSNLSFSNHHLNCTFYKEKTYMLRFIQYGDVCQENINLEEKYSVCEKLIDYIIKVQGKKTRINVEIIIYIVIVIYVLLFIIILICVLRKTKCFKRNYISVRFEIDDKNKNILYVSEPEIDEDEMKENENAMYYYNNEITHLKNNIELNPRKKKFESFKYSTDLSSDRHFKSSFRKNEIEKGVIEDMNQPFESNYTIKSKGGKVNYITEAGKLQNIINEKNDVIFEKKKSEKDMK